MGCAAVAIVARAIVARATVAAPLAVVAVGARPAVACAQAVRYEGPARSGARTGTARLELTIDARSGRAHGTLRLANGLAGEARLAGVVRGGAMRLEGVLVASGTRYDVGVDARAAADGVLGGVYLLTPQGGGEPRRGGFRLTRQEGAGEAGGGRAR